MSEIAYYGEAASPVTVANTTVTNSQDSGQVAALAGGGFVMVWRDASGAANPGPDIRAQIFDASGAKVGGEFLVNTILTTNVAVPTVTGTPDGGFVVSWSDQTNGIRARAFSSTGAAATPGEITVQDSNAGTVGQSGVAALANGNYMVTWGVTGTTVGGVTPRDVHAKIYDASGNVVATDFIVSSSTTGNQGLPRVAAVGNSFVVTWTDDRVVNGQNVGQEILAQRFDQNGVALGSEINVDGAAANNQTAATITATADGGFEIVWLNYTTGATTGDTLSAQHFTANGTPVGGVVDVSANFYNGSGFAGQFSAPAIVADAQGGFVASWVAITTVGTSSYRQVVAQQFDADGNALGDVIVLSNFEVNAAQSVAGARLASGQIVSAWASTDNASPQQGVDVRFQLFDVYQRIFGTDIAETLANNSGKKAAIEGRGGDDVITGHSGDQIDGGDGNDRITVDGAHATIYGGAGNDVIEGVSDQVYGGDGNDQIHVVGTNVAEVIVLDGGDGDDVIVADGSYSAVSIYGDAGNDTLTGSFGNDFISGGDGNDRLIGRGGTDMLIGGLGDDTYSVNNASSTIIENAGEGTDTVETSLNNFILGTTAGSTNVENLTLKGSAVTGSGNSMANVLTGNALDNTLYGYDGNDTLVGAGGADSLFGGGGNDRLIVGAGGNGSIVDGGADTDTLVVTGSVSLGDLSNVEAIELQSSANLTLTGNQFTGLPVGTVLSGTGTITANLDPDQFLLGSTLSVAAGASIAMVFNGSSGNDYVKAVTQATNTMLGGDGNDFLRGGQLADVIDGGADGDKITGFGGADTLTGGSGADQFRYLGQGDSGVGANADHITDFEIGTDYLDFRLFDGDPAAPDLQTPAFGFIADQAFHATGAAEIRYETAGSNLLVQVDVDGDGTADMAIYLDGLGGAMLTAADFTFANGSGASVGGVDQAPSVVRGGEAIDGGGMPEMVAPVFGHFGATPLFMEYALF